ncbi:response regulator, partial [Acinetobacter baumannii]
MQTPHILIVEDELVTRNTLKSIFEAEGYDVFEATDGAEMHQILSENDINLVIMDIN